MVEPYRGYVPDVAAAGFVAPSASVIGDVTLGPESSIWDRCVVRGDVSRIRIGARTNIQDGTVIHVSSYGDGPGYDTLIGDNVTVGHCCLIHACTVEDRALVGMGSVVLDGAVVGAGAMLGAGALLPENKRVPPGQLWLGRPARYHRDLTEAEMAELDVMADHYVRLAAQHRADRGARAE